MHDHVVAAVLHLAQQSISNTPPWAKSLKALLSWGIWMATFACIVGVLIVGARMAILHSRGEAAQHLAGLFWVLFGGVLVAGAAALMSAVGLMSL